MISFENVVLDEPLSPIRDYCVNPFKKRSWEKVTE